MKKSIRKKTIPISYKDYMYLSYNNIKNIKEILHIDDYIKSITMQESIYENSKYLFVQELSNSQILVKRNNSYKVLNIKDAYVIIDMILYTDLVTNCIFKEEPELFKNV